MQSDREIVFIGTNTLRVLVYVILEDAALGGQRWHFARVTFAVEGTRIHTYSLNTCVIRSIFIAFSWIVGGLILLRKSTLRIEYMRIYTPYIHQEPPVGHTSNATTPVVHTHRHIHDTQIFLYNVMLRYNRNLKCIPFRRDFTSAKPINCHPQHAAAAAVHSPRNRCCRCILQTAYKFAFERRHVWAKRASKWMHSEYCVMEFYISMEHTTHITHILPPASIHIATR